MTARDRLDGSEVYSRRGDPVRLRSVHGAGTAHYRTSGKRDEAGGDCPARDGFAGSDLSGDRTGVPQVRSDEHGATGTLGDRELPGHADSAGWPGDSASEGSEGTAKHPDQAGPHPASADRSYSQPKFGLRIYKVQAYYLSGSHSWTRGPAVVPWAGEGACYRSPTHATSIANPASLIVGIG